MKTILNAFVLLCVLSLFPTSLLAQGTERVTPPGSEPSQTESTPGTGNSAGTAEVTSPGTGTPPTGGTAPKTDPSPVQDTPSTGSGGGEGGQPADTFTSLTQLPGISEVNNELVNADSLPALFNSLYRMCIGAAAVIAVIQIMRAGVKFMTKGGSVSANTEAKDMIRNAILGLVLVLSPAIVFGIINPRILNLELSIGGLQPKNLEDVNLVGTDVNGDGVIDGYDSPDAQQCRANYTTPTQVQQPQSCTTLGNDFEAVTNVCCDNFRPGYTCCARKKSADPSVAKSEYWWRVAVKDGSHDTSVLGSISPKPPKIEQSPQRFDSQQKCLESFNAAMYNSVTMTRKEITKTYCDCTKPRSEFAECKD